MVVLPLLLLVAVAVAWSVRAESSGKGRIFGLTPHGSSQVGFGGPGAMGKPVTFGFLEICAVNAPVRIIEVKPLATTAPLRLRAGLSRAYPSSTLDRPDVGRGALPWKLGRLSLCGPASNNPTLTSVGIEVTRLTSAPATVNGLVVRFRDEKGGEHTVKAPQWHYTVSVH